jgi:hypothetical protein
MFWLGPTFPSHTGAVPTTAVGQTTSIAAQFDTLAAGWLVQDATVDIDLVEVHHVTDAAHCSQGPSAIPAVQGLFKPATYQMNLSDSGFTWPSAATQTAWGSPYFAVCLHQNVPSAATQPPDVLSGDASAIGTNAVFQVMSDYAPAISLSTAVPHAGESLTVYGEHWNYYQRTYTDLPNNGMALQVRYDDSGHTYIGLNTTVSPSIDANGSFAQVIAIPSDYPPRQYYIFPQNNWFGVPQFFQLLDPLPPTAVPQPTPTSPPSSAPTATSAPSPTATFAPTVTSAPSPTAFPTATPTLPAGEPPQRIQRTPAFPWTSWLIVAVAVVLTATGGVLAKVVRDRRGRVPMGSPDPGDAPSDEGSASTSDP